MSNKIANSVIGSVSSVISKYYYSHSKIDTLFMEAGAPGDTPEGNLEVKCKVWLQRSNEDTVIDSFEVLGAVLQDFMDHDLQPHNSEEVKMGRDRIVIALEKNQLSYQTNGYITLIGASSITKTLEDYLKAGDFGSIEKEFQRTIEHINTDPHASVTASCSIIESLCKVYIESFNEIDMPSKQSVGPLWKTVQQHMGLNANRLLADDQRKMLHGLSSIVDSIGAFRTHIGSAHGRGLEPPKIAVSEARLAVNSAHTLVVFIMERWHEN